MQGIETMTVSHVGMRPLPQVINWLFGLIGWVLLLPPLFLVLLALVLAISTLHPIVIVFQIAAVYGHTCLLRWTLALNRGQRFQLSRWHKVGLVVVPLYSVALLALYFSGFLGVFPSILYFSLAPSVLLILCRWRQAGLAATSGDTIAPRKRTRLISTAAYSWLGLIGVMVVVSMMGALSIRDLGQAAELVHPFNLINWSIALILAAPAFLLLKWSEQGTRS